jgi:hypothetical protein
VETHGAISYEEKRKAFSLLFKEGIKGELLFSS